MPRQIRCFHRFHLIAVALLLAAALPYPDARAGSLPRDMVQNEILIIFNHGSSTGNHLDCYKPLLNRKPRWLKDLDGTSISGMKVRVTTPCTATGKGTFPDAKGCGEVWVCRRAEAIRLEIAKALDRGYPPEHIFVGGQSAGGWASLLLKRWRPELFNAVIATAPAFNGRRRNRLCDHPRCAKGDPNKIWQSKMRKQHDVRLGLGLPRRSKPDLRALVISFPCDPFGWPSELPFAGNRSVSQVIYPKALKDVRQCAGPRKRYRHDAGRKNPTLRCKEPENGTSARRTAAPFCGSGNKTTDRSYGKILNCPKHLKKLCALDQHAQVHRSRNFQDFVATSGIVRAFIETRLSDNWQPVASTLPETSPCDFIRYPGVCER